MSNISKNSNGRSSLPGADSSLVLVADELINGVTYGIFQKKNQNGLPPSPRKTENGENEEATASSPTVHSTQLRLVRHGTLPALIRCLVPSNGDLNSSLVNTILATYRTFCSATELLDHIRRQLFEFQHSNRDGACSDHLFYRNLRSVLCAWLDGYCEDFSDHPRYSLLAEVSAICNDCSLLTEVRERVINCREKCIAAEAERKAQLEHRASYVVDQLESVMDSARGLYSFDDIPVEQIAEQLTYVDAALFCRLVPHQCLSPMWNSKSKRTVAPTVCAIVDQFNGLLHRVVYTILHDASVSSPQRRAMVIQKWIQVAQELRILKNFCSLKAIISALQSEPVHRLQKTWNHVPKDTTDVFDELARIFNGEDNQSLARELLLKEGTAKFAGLDLDSPRTRHHKKKMSRGKSWFGPASFTGTIPYLGTFLTDLTMLDSAMSTVFDDEPAINSSPRSPTSPLLRPSHSTPDHCRPNRTKDRPQINIDKKRKEFEILVQLKLLQSSAACYSFREDISFKLWYQQLKPINEQQSYELSLIAETNTTSPGRSTQWHVPIPGVIACSLPSASPRGHRRVASASGPAIRPISSALASPIIPRSRVSSERLQPSSSPGTPDEDTLSLGSASSEGSRSKNSSFNDKTFKRHQVVSRTASQLSKASLASQASYDSDLTTSMSSDDMRVVKVTLQDCSIPQLTDNTNYKSIRITHNEKATSVIRRVLDKFGVTEKDCRGYHIYQKIKENEVSITDNVFYALNTNVGELRLLVRPRSQDSPMGSRNNSKGKVETEKFCTRL